MRGVYCNIYVDCCTCAGFRRLRIGDSIMNTWRENLEVKLAETKQKGELSREFRSTHFHNFSVLLATRTRRTPKQIGK